MISRRGRIGGCDSVAGGVLSPSGWRGRTLVVDDVERAAVGRADFADAGTRLTAFSILLAQAAPIHAADPVFRLCRPRPSSVLLIRTR